MRDMNKKLKIVIIILIILVFGFIIYKTITYKERPFKEIQLNKTSLVLNSSKVPYIDTILHIGLDSMGIHNIVVTVYDLTDEMKNNFSTSIDLKANLYIDDGLYFLWIANMNRKETLRVISHELIHFRQYYDKDLWFKNGHLVWKGDSVNLESIYYYDRPWEIEAFSKQDSIYKILVKELF
jgi:hypothetical protein